MAVGSARVTGLELDKKIHARAMEGFQPELVMTLRFNLYQLGSDDHYKGSILLSLTDYRDGAMIWKSSQEFSAINAIIFRNGPSSDMGIEFANEVLQKLRDDGVLPKENPVQAGNG